MSYISTFGGNIIDYLTVDKYDIYIPDIMRSLPRLNRFVGHSSRSYSVGEHTILCYHLATLLGYSVREQLLVLIHDFTEAYVGDCPSPLKALIPEYSAIEDRVNLAIYEHIGIPTPTIDEYKKIKAVDLTMLVIEMRDLTNHTHEEFIGGLVEESVLDKLYIDQNIPEEDLIRNVLHGLFEETLDKYRGENN